MAYLNEFPQWDGNGRNLDWLLEQYSTFNARIQQILDEFNSAVSQMQSDIANLELEYDRKLDNFESRVLNEVATITNAIEQISSNVSDYVSEHMSEWQLDAMVGENNDVIIGDYDPEEPITSGGNVNVLIINNKKYVINEVGYMGYWLGLTLNLENLDLLAASTTTMGKQVGADVTSANERLYTYFQQCEEEFGLDQDNYIDYDFPYVANPSRSNILEYAKNQVVLGPIKVLKGTNKYTMRIKYATGNYTETLNGIGWHILPLFPYLD